MSKGTEVARGEIQRVVSEMLVVLYGNEDKAERQIGVLSLKIGRASKKQIEEIDQHLRAAYRPGQWSLGDLLTRASEEEVAEAQQQMIDRVASSSGRRSRQSPHSRRTRSQ